MRVAAAAMLLLLVASLAVTVERWSWARICVRICAPFLPKDASAAWVESFRRAMDWQAPLLVAAGAAAVLAALVAAPVIARHARTARRRAQR